MFGSAGNDARLVRPPALGTALAAVPFLAIIAGVRYDWWQYPTAAVIFLEPATVCFRAPGTPCHRGVLGCPVLRFLETGAAPVVADGTCPSGRGSDCSRVLHGANANGSRFRSSQSRDGGACGLDAA